MIPYDGPEILDADQRLEALAIVRETLDSWVLRGVRPAPRIDSSLNGIFAPAFVTLLAEARLRGCVGILHPTAALAETLSECAVAAASKDSRFPAVTPEALPEIRCEISVLTPPAKLEDTEALRVGRDGLIVEESGRRGLLLPQVAAHQGWDRETFLDQVSLKAGLPKGAWNRGALLWTFQAQVFAEADSPAAGTAPLR